MSTQFSLIVPPQLEASSSFSSLISTSAICLSFCRLRLCHGGIAACTPDVSQVTSLNLFIPLTFDYATGKARQPWQQDVDGCV